MTVESWRELANTAMTDALETYGAAAASAAVDLFDDVIEQSGLDVRGSMPVGIYSRDEIMRIARYQAEKLRRDDLDGFIEQCSRSAGFLAYQGGNRAMWYQGGMYHGTNPSRAFSYRLYHKRGEKVYGQYQVRYARVPCGTETCDFCLMLASRGFVYLSEESAEGTNHVHRGCDCVVVPGVGHFEDGAERTSMGDWVQDTTIEGMDRDDLTELHGRWSDITALGLDEEEAHAMKLDAMQDVLGRRSW